MESQISAVGRASITCRYTRRVIEPVFLRSALLSDGEKI